MTTRNLKLALTKGDLQIHWLWMRSGGRGEVDVDWAPSRTEVDPKRTLHPALAITDPASHSCHGGMTNSHNYKSCPVLDLGSR